MDLVRQIGGKRLAAPPAGATDRSGLDLLRVAERYRAILDLGDQMDVVPQVEVWGFSQTLGRLGEAALVAIESGHAQACVLPDIYHLYKGGSGFSGLRLLGPHAMHVIHVNDYPAEPPRGQVTDAHRVYPGDGIAPLEAVFRDLAAAGFRGMLSLELFNRDYWKEDALTVARRGIEKTRAIVERSLNSE
jgi:sugar phosphate isomerase/epimerase